MEKKERQWSQKRERPRLSVRQQQIKKDNELWENNRLARSGNLLHSEDVIKGYISFVKLIPISSHDLYLRFYEIGVHKPS